jgi:hypothetical protein
MQLRGQEGCRELDSGLFRCRDDSRKFDSRSLRGRDLILTAHSRSHTAFEQDHSKRMFQGALSAPLNSSCFHSMLSKTDLDVFRDHTSIYIYIVLFVRHYSSDGCLSDSNCIG